MEKPPKKKPAFRRNYIACLNCRTRKVKCDLGSVENPHDPPCARCRRERKECVFVDPKKLSNHLLAHNQRKTLLNNNNNSVNNVNNVNNINNNNTPIQNNSTNTIKINPILPLPNPYFHSKPILLNNNNTINNNNNNNPQNIQSNL